MSNKYKENLSELELVNMFTDIKDEYLIFYKNKQLEDIDYIDTNDILFYFDSIDYNYNDIKDSCIVYKKAFLEFDEYYKIKDYMNILYSIASTLDTKNKEYFISVNDEIVDNKIDLSECITLEFIRDYLNNIEIYKTLVF